MASPARVGCHSRCSPATEGSPMWASGCSAHQHDNINSSPNSRRALSEGANTDIDPACYLDELLRELREVSRMQMEQPGTLRHSTHLISAEIDRVWTVIYPACARNVDSSPIETSRRDPSHPYSKHHHISPLSLSTPQLTESKDVPRFKSVSPSGRHSPMEFKNLLHSSVNLTPTRTPLASSPLGTTHADARQQVTIQQRIPIPNNPHARCNFIGRILGPRGISVKQLETETACSVLIRGQGSVKDPEREARLRGIHGWEHLSEPLHVLVSATASDRKSAQQKLERGVASVRRLLTPGDDEHKRRQLVQLAIINGTYRPAENAP